MSRESPASANQSGESAELVGLKEIRKYLNQRWGAGIESERTVERWVEKRGLPIYKRKGDPRVRAHPKELDEWWLDQLKSPEESQTTGTTVSPPGPGGPQGPDGAAESLTTETTPRERTTGKLLNRRRAAAAVLLAVLGIGAVVWIVLSGVTRTGGCGENSLAGITEILSPSPSEVVPRILEVVGHAPPRTRVSLIVHPQDVAEYWVQPPVTLAADGSCRWWGTGYIGREGDADKGKVFEIRAIADPAEELPEGRVLPTWPAGAGWSEIVRVVRR